MNRREFVKSAGTVGLASTFGTQLGAAEGIISSDEFDIVEATVSEIHAAYFSGELTAQELIQQYIDRIDAYDEDVNTVISLNENALDRAEELDEEFADSGPVGPLHGIPIVLKDNIDTADLPTTGGNVLFEDTTPPDDAFIAAQLRNAGGIILAKVNLGEFASGSLSSLGGQTRNPYDLHRSPSGSSAGTGAAIAANLATIGVGTDTGGSVRSPAAVNSQVGFRPTTGLISRDGIIPLSETLDSAGPMTRTVADTAVMLDAMAGYDPQDPGTAQPSDEIPEESYTSYLDSTGLSGVRLGVIREYVEDDPEETGIDAGEPLAVADIFDSAISDLEALGATVVDPVEIPQFEFEDILDIVIAEFKRDLNAYIDSLGDAAPVEDMQEILDSETIEGSILSLFEPAVEVDSETLDQNTDYLSTLNDRQTLRRNLFVVMAENDLDGFIYPTRSRTPARIDSDRPSGSNTGLSPFVAFPSITVPAGYSDETGLPVGLSFLTKPFEEPSLLAWAYSYEQATRHRHPPEDFGPIE